MSKPFLCISILVGVALWVSLGSFFDGCHWVGHPHCPSEMCMYGYISNNDTWSHTKKQKYKPNVWVPCPCCPGHGRPSCLQWYHIKPALRVCVLCRLRAEPCVHRGEVVPDTTAWGCVCSEVNVVAFLALACTRRGPRFKGMSDEPGRAAQRTLQVRALHTPLLCCSVYSK